MKLRVSAIEFVDVSAPSGGGSALRELRRAYLAALARRAVEAEPICYCGDVRFWAPSSFTIRTTSSGRKGFRRVRLPGTGRGGLGEKSVA